MNSTSLESPVESVAPWRAAGICPRATRAPRVARWESIQIATETISQEPCDPYGGPKSEYFPHQERRGAPDQNAGYHEAQRG
jgi:hypothetical protein